MSGKKHKWELAFEDYQNGLKTKEIAKKHNVSDGTIRSWKSRYWGQKRCNENTKTLQQDKSVATKKGGQKGNRNSVKHGAYATYFQDLIDPQMLEAINNEKYLTAKDEYEKELKDLRFRKFHLQQQVRDIILKYGDTGLVANSAIDTTNYRGSNETSSQLQEIKESTQALLTPLQTELTKVQKAIIKVLELISKLDDSSSNELDKLDEILTRIKQSSES